MIRPQHALIILPFCLASCTATVPTNQAVVDETPVSVHVPELRVSPSVWETAGASLAPTLQIVDGQNQGELTLRLAYTGDGQVTIPETVVVPAGVTEITLEQPFEVAPDTTGEGVVEVFWVSPTVGDVLVAEVPVLMVDTIVEGFEIHRAESLVDSTEWATSYVVIVEMVAPPEEHAAGVHECRRLQLEALVPKQGRFNPGTQVLENVNYDDYPNLPRELVLEGNRFATIVSVAHPQAPAVKRAYLKLNADVGGHKKTKHVPLRF